MPPAGLARRLEHPRAEGSSAPLCSPSSANSHCPPQCPLWLSHRHRGAAQPRQAWGSWAGGGGRTAGALSSASFFTDFLHWHSTAFPNISVWPGGWILPQSMGSMREGSHMPGTSSALPLLQVGRAVTMPLEQAGFGDPDGEMCPEEASQQGGFCSNFSFPGRGWASEDLCKGKEEH